MGRSRRRPPGQGQALATAELFARTGLLQFAGVSAVQSVLSADEQVVDRKAFKEVAAGVHRSAAVRASRAAEGSDVR
ncbi:hypothetical protein FNF29_00917 [Cafeteria roenbergensis]|nr:hypothetical protein FNF29_00917 [Cafeteria roenbergensis]KAA0159324.1 hypothetical protein FNF31_04913 [Cafeteria roenbergensis]|eukprot:KAA0156806.1 hypothetical protein FNF29_00917 [Cafeteria roenbergensis]